MASKARDIARGIFPASTATRAAFRMASGVAPSNPQEGDMWRIGNDVFIRTSGKTVKLTDMVDQTAAKSIAKKAAITFG